MSTESSSPKVFISYSQGTIAQNNRVLALADRLGSDGIDCNIDQYEQSLEEGLQRWMLNQIESADLVLVVCSEQYNRRFRGQEKIGEGKGAIWEGSIIINELYQSQGLNSKFIPILMTKDDSKFIPTPLRSAKYYRMIEETDYELLYRRLTGQHLTPKREIGKPRKLDECERPQLFPEILPVNSNPTNLTPTGLTSFQRRQLELQRDGLLPLWDAQHEKVIKMKMALIIETSTTVKFQLDQQLLVENRELSKLGSELDEIEQKLNY